MSFQLDFFGKIATFEGAEAEVAESLSRNLTRVIGENLKLECQKRALEEKLKATEQELHCLQKIVDDSISTLDPSWQ